MWKLVSKEEYELHHRQGPRHVTGGGRMLLGTHATYTEWAMEGSPADLRFELYPDGGEMYFKWKA